MLVELNDSGETYDEMRAKVDRDLYGITNDDPNIPYPWDRRAAIEPTQAKETPQEVKEVVLIAA